MQSRTVRPARNILGTVAPPGDKSISHRYAMLAAGATGRSTIQGFAGAADCASTLQCLRTLGVAAETTADGVVIEGRGLRGLQAPTAVLDAGNSGSTIRMLSGILAAQSFRSEI